MYICKQCGKVFVEPELDVEIEAHWECAEFGNVPTEEFRTWRCPSCGSEDFAPASECAVCGDWHANDGVLCDDCLASLGQDIDKIRVSLGLTTDDFELAVQENFGW